MTIELLSPRLANQIAAGEVVERPSSVVKELIENSLDAGATQIIIDIEKGGCKQIRIRDNGCGVDKSQLTLALSRHATSKISHLDDLHAIVSLGFRGEALASISSVSRLTFTSKTQQQSEAWQAYAQGREMAVEITPAAHPVGTSVEVNDLFFNTPARRRFLRTEKTEFTHIDELVKRFALSRFDVEFILTHNQKMLRNLKVASTQAQKERRVAAICGNRLIDDVIAIDNDHNDIKLSGWLGLPQACRTNSDTQYCYVNGRMMRDKLINHAIRQAYDPWLAQGVMPSYVLYIELDPTQVDVNVHPAKHEVRFHQSRMIHDLIHQVLSSGLSQAMQPLAHAGNIEPEVAQHQYNKQHVEQTTTDNVVGNRVAESVSSTRAMPNYQPQYRPEYTHSELKQGTALYSQLLDTKALPDVHMLNAVDILAPTQVTDKCTDDIFGDIVAVVESVFLLVNYQQSIELVNLNKLSTWLESQLLQATWGQGFKAQPLLLPVAIEIDSVLLEQLPTHHALLRRLGIDIVERRPQIIIKQVPAQLRNRDIAMLIPQLLTLLNQQQHLNSDDLSVIICDWLAKMDNPSYSLQQATDLLTKAQGFQDDLMARRHEFSQQVDFSSTLAIFK